MNITATLIQGVREVQRENAERKKENAYLTEQVENLWTTIRKLEAIVYRMKPVKMK